MIYYKLSKVLSREGYTLNKARQFFRDFWLKGFMLLFLFYLVIEKDINFHFSIGSTNENAKTEKSTGYVTPVNVQPTESFKAVAAVETEKVHKEVKHDQFSMSNILSIYNFFEGSNKAKASKSSAGKSFRNLSFVLHPEYVQKYGVERAVVEEKIGICVDYVKRFESVAKSEMKKYGIPASIKLAQGLLESDAGQSKLTQKCKNHFGIKCFSKNCKKGHCANFSDDSHKDFFRHYENAWESFRAHSKVLEKERYRNLYQLDKKDYKSWARGLKKAGYATDPKYADKLIQIIETLKLYTFDE